MGYTHAIDSLKGVLITLGTSIGAVMLVYGGIKFAMAFRQMAQQGEHQAVYSVVTSPPEQQAQRFLMDAVRYCIILFVAAHLWEILGYIIEFSDGITSSLGTASGYILFRLRVKVVPPPGVSETVIVL